MQNGRSSVWCADNSTLFIFKLFCFSSFPFTILNSFSMLPSSNWSESGASSNGSSTNFVDIPVSKIVETYRGDTDLLKRILTAKMQEDKVNTYNVPHPCVVHSPAIVPETSCRKNSSGGKAQLRSRYIRSAIGPSPERQSPGDITRQLS